MKILGISAYYHDSAAALIIDGNVVAAASEERFTRKKQDDSFPTNAIKYVLSEAELSLGQVDRVVFYDRPLLKFERLLETYHSFAPRGLVSFITSMPIWLKNKIFQRKIITEELQKISTEDAPPLHFSEHHLSHAASAYYTSPYDDAAIVTVDGVGEWATTTIGRGNGNEVEIIKEQHFPHSLGLLYSSFTHYLGFRVNSGEYKLMGLAPYGNKDSEQVNRFQEIIENHLISIKSDGSIALNMKHFDFATGLKMCSDRKWFKLFGIKRRKPESEITQEHMNLALAIQLVTNKIMIALARHAKEITGANNLVLAGGVALNCVSNGELSKEKIFDNIWIHPAAGDAGASLGAALAYYYMATESPRSRNVSNIFSPYLGPSYSDEHIKVALEGCNLDYKKLDETELTDLISEELANGKIVGWFQGRMEWGPRALGNRSILADPRNPQTQKVLNLKIKKREGFRPFAPSILEEHFDDYFSKTDRSYYMLLIGKLKESLCLPKPDGYESFDLYKKLYFKRSNIPAVTHIDYSARPQVVSTELNPLYHELISKFHTKTGCPMVVNTSFNVRGEPIVCSPIDAINCFSNTEMDLLVMGSFLVTKK